MTAQQKRIALLGIGAGIICLVVVLWPQKGMTPTPEELSVDMSSTATNTSGVVPTERERNPTTSLVTSKTQSQTSVLFEYTEAARNRTYHIPWTTQRGTYASVSLFQNGNMLSVLPNCQHMPIYTGRTSYCIWTPEQLGPKQSADNFSLLLTTYTASGTILDSVRSSTFKSVADFTSTFTQERNDLFGWSVRYPDTWLVKRGADYTVIANNLAGIQHPSDSHEALVVESCSLAREACTTRQKNFTSSLGVQERTLGGKRSVSRSISSGTEYIREDMLVRNGTVYFVSVRSIDADGTLRSPYTRSIVDSFGYEPSSIAVGTYAFDGMFSTGALFVEHTNNSISYVRLYTGVEGCISTVRADTFTEVSSSRFVITDDVCRIDGRKSGNAFTIEEKNCEKIRTEKCTFEGTYIPTN